jgi:hypothetical protein
MAMVLIPSLLAVLVMRTYTHNVSRGLLSITGQFRGVSATYRDLASIRNQQNS